MADTHPKVVLLTRRLFDEIQDRKMSPEYLGTLCDGFPAPVTIRRWLNKGEAAPGGSIEARRDHVEVVAHVLRLPIGELTADAQLSDEDDKLLDFAASLGPYFYPAIGPLFGFRRDHCIRIATDHMIPSNHSGPERFRVRRWAECQRRLKGGAAISRRNATQALNWARSQQLSAQSALEFHFQCGVVLEDHALTVQAGIEWVRSAMKQGGFLEAIWVGLRYFNTVVGDAIPPPAPEQHVLLLQTSQALRTAGRAPEARALLFRYHMAYFTRAEPIERAEYRLELACACYYCGERRKAHTDASEVVRMLEGETSPRGIALAQRALLERIHLELIGGRPGEAEKSIATLLTLARNSPEQELRIYRVLAIQAQNSAVTDPSALDRAREYLEQTLELAIARRQLREQGIARYSMGVHLALRGEFEHALSMFEQALNNFHDHDAGELSLALVYSALGEAYFDLGNYAQAKRALGTSMGLYRKIGGLTHHSLMVLILQLDVAVAAGDTAVQAGLASQAWDSAAQAGDEGLLLAALSANALADPGCTAEYIDKITAELAGASHTVSLSGVLSVRWRLHLTRALRVDQADGIAALQEYAAEVEALGLMGPAKRARRSIRQLGETEVKT